MSKKQFLINKIYTIANYDRSVIFIEEVDKLLNKSKYRDRIYGHFILKFKRIVYVILLYYTGLRKNELLSRHGIFAILRTKSLRLMPIKMAYTRQVNKTTTLYFLKIKILEEG